MLLTGHKDGKILIWRLQSYIGVLDEELRPVEWIQLTSYEPAQGGGMRPWMEREDDRLVIVYDRQNQLVMMDIQLDLEALGAAGWRSWF